MSKAISYSEVKIINKPAINFGDAVFNSFISLDGGVQLGTMFGLAGTSGAGKTTLCKKFQVELKQKKPSVFFALESRKSSVARQTKRIITGENELICDVDDFPTWSEFMAYIYETKPLLVIVDSLQHAADLLTKENGVYKYENYKNIIKDLYEWKDKTQGIVFLIIQLNAKNQIEGPQSTLFDVDVPIFLIADENTNERTLITKKNRMGPIGSLKYEFVDTQECIKFYTEEEWAGRHGTTRILELIEVAIKKYSVIYKSNDNYPKFKKELTSRYKKVYDEEDWMKSTLSLIEIIQELETKYFC